MKMVRLALLALIPALAFTVAGCGDTSTQADMNIPVVDMATTADLKSTD